MADFPREKRLTRPAEYRRVFQRGYHRRFQQGGLLLRVRENHGVHPRLGLAIPKRALKKAVDRNRVKRLARESFRHHCQSLPAVDIVLFGQSELLSMDNAVILRQLDVLWNRLRDVYSRAERASQTPYSP